MNKFYKILILCVITIIAAVGISLTAIAAPLWDFPVTVEQPDGMVLEILVSGDEFFNVLHDEEHRVILRNEDTQVYTYAAIVDGRLQATDFEVKSVVTHRAEGMENVQFATLEDIPDQYFTTVRSAMEIEFPDMSSAELSSSNAVDSSIAPLNLTVPRQQRSNQFLNRQINDIVVFIAFSDTPFPTAGLSRSFYNGLFNTNANSLRNFMNTVSYGQTTVQSHFPGGNATTILVYTSPNPRSFYVGGTAANNYFNSNLHIPANNRQSMRARGTRQLDLIRRAVAFIGNHVPANLNLDVNGDGWIDCISFVVAGGVASGNNQILWPHQWHYDSLVWNAFRNPNYNPNTPGSQEFLPINWDNERRTIRGKYVGAFTFHQYNVLIATNTNVTAQIGSAILAHEFLHVLGFPDLYQGFNSFTTMRNWCIMSSSNGGGLSAYMKFRYGNWIDIPEITANGTFSLTALNVYANRNQTRAYAIRTPNSANEYFIIEYRRQEGPFEINIGNIPNIVATGLVVYRINTDWDGRGNWRDGGVINANQVEIHTLMATNGIQTGNIGQLILTNNVGSGITINQVQQVGNRRQFNVTVPTTTAAGFRDRRIIREIARQRNTTEAAIVSNPNAHFPHITELRFADDRWFFNPNTNEVEHINNFQNYGLPLDLTGIQQLTNLRILDAPYTRIQSITPLANLTQLHTLYLHRNNITNISPLTGRTSLRRLTLRGNNITNFTPTNAYFNLLQHRDFRLTPVADVFADFRSVPATLNEAFTNNQIVFTFLDNIRPNDVYIEFEVFNQQTGARIFRSDIAPIWLSITPDILEQLAFNYPSRYIRINLYERPDRTQLISSTVASQFIRNMSGF